MSLKIDRKFVHAIFVTAIYAQALSLQAQSSAVTPHRFGNPADEPREVIGIKDQNCSRCHLTSGPKGDYELPPDLRSAGDDGWILEDELSTWSRFDHHYNAFAVLQNEQSRQMATLLGIVDEKNGNSLVHRDRRCLSCHSSIPVNQMELTGDLVRADTLEDPRYTIGVSCEACHGPAGKAASGGKGWGAAHANPGENLVGLKTRWRMLTPAEKFDNFGYWDVRSPETQSRICLSCHLGDVEQKKIITHEMYAAGHPPLPSFELSQFVRQMPRHWRRLDEKPESVRNKYLKDQQAFLKSAEDSEEISLSGEPAILKSTMISAMVAFEVAMRFTADSIDETSAKSLHPELANYSCYSCHHELVRNGWRKSRRSTSPPGRPTLHEWPIILANVVQQTVSVGGNTSQELQTKYAAVVAELNAQPFGKPKQLRAATLELADVASQFRRQLASTKIDDVHSLQFLKNLAKYGATHDLDYDSARQLVWAYERSLTERMRLKVNDGAEQPLREEMQFGHDQDLTLFEQRLLLWLRTNRKDPSANNQEPRPERFPHKERAINLSHSLERISRYDPAEVRPLFQHLLDQLERASSE